MSTAREDWHEFEVMSGQISICDPTYGDDKAIVINAECGEWVAMTLRDDDHHIRTLAAMRKWVAERIDHNKVEISADSDFDTANIRSRLVSVSDRVFADMLPEGFSVPEHKLNDKIVERRGVPEGKDGVERFVETCFHLGYNGETGMPRVESTGYGIVFGMDADSIGVNVLYNDGRDAMAFEIRRDDERWREGDD